MRLADELAALSITKNSDRGIIRRAVEALRAAEKARAQAANWAGCTPAAHDHYGCGMVAASRGLLRLLDERPIAAERSDDGGR